MKFDNLLENGIYRAHWLHDWGWAQFKLANYLFRIQLTRLYLKQLSASFVSCSTIIVCRIQAFQSKRIPVSYVTALLNCDLGVAGRARNVPCL